jgi:hypothetical protein
MKVSKQTIVMKPLQTNQSQTNQSQTNQSQTNQSQTNQSQNQQKRSFSDGDFVLRQPNEETKQQAKMNSQGMNETASTEENVVVLKPKLLKEGENEKEKGFVSKLGRKRDNPVKKHNRGWNNELIRISYFDERQKETGRTEQPRVVTIVWSYNRTTGLLKYGADVWTSFRSNDVFCKITERGHALLRYQTEPIVVHFEPGLGTNAEILKNLRWLVYRFGVSNKSPRYLKFAKTYEVQHRTQ